MSPRISACIPKQAAVLSFVTAHGILVCMVNLRQKFNSKFKVVRPWSCETFLKIRNAMKSLVAQHIPESFTSNKTITNTSSRGPKVCKKDFQDYSMTIFSTIQGPFPPTISKQFFLVICHKTAGSKAQGRWTIQDKLCSLLQDSYPSLDFFQCQHSYPRWISS
jgi:hypothetical protein